MASPRKRRERKAARLASSVIVEETLQKEEIEIKQDLKIEAVELVDSLLEASEEKLETQEEVELARTEKSASSEKKKKKKKKTKKGTISLFGNKEE